MTEGSNQYKFHVSWQQQAEEWDYVILSTVRSTPGALGALEDEHLLDVALTRARHGAGALSGWGLFWARMKISWKKTITY